MPVHSPSLDRLIVNMTTTTPHFIHSSVAEERPKVDTEHVEHAIQHRPRLSTRLPPSQLPHITAEEVAREGSGKDGRLCKASHIMPKRLGLILISLGLVVDSVVYDCSDFVSSHPGGPAFIRGFASQDCSWQVR